MKLTDIQIKRAKPTAKPHKVSDGGGLFLWVTPSGGKIWRWTYRHEAKAKLMSFGSYPDVSLSLARERHIEARKLPVSGVNPMAQRKAEKAALENSFQNIATLWQEHWQHGKSPRHVDYVKRRMDADIFPCLGTHGIQLEVVKHTEAKRGFVLLPRRWVVERSFAWTARFRRLARDYERLSQTLAGIHYFAFACLMLTQLFKLLNPSS